MTHVKVEVEVGQKGREEVGEGGSRVRIGKISNVI